MSALRIALLAASVCGLFAVMPHAVTAWLVFDRDAILAGQVWRLWTAHGVHFSWSHATIDSLTLFAVVWALARHGSVRTVVWALLAGAPLIALGLLLAVPDMRVYAGASGLVMLVAATAGGKLWRDVPRLRGLLGLLAAAAVIRLALDASGVLLPFGTLPDGIRVAWQAHALGLILGGLFAVGVKRPDERTALPMAHPAAESRP